MVVVVVVVSVSMAVILRRLVVVVVMVVSLGVDDGEFDCDCDGEHDLPDLPDCDEDLADDARALLRVTRLTMGASSSEEDSLSDMM